MEKKFIKAHIGGGPRGCRQAVHERRRAVHLPGSMARMLDYYGMGFGDEEMTVLCEWFPTRCEEVEKLYLQNNAFTATGWDLLAEVVGSSREGAMPKLKEIYAYNKDKASDKLSGGVREEGVELSL